MTQEEAERQRQNRSLQMMLWCVVESSGGEVVIPDALYVEAEQGQRVTRLDDLAARRTVLRTRSAPGQVPVSVS